jgi:hypothetical protein
MLTAPLFFCAQADDAAFACRVLGEEVRRGEALATGFESG